MKEHDKIKINQCTITLTRNCNLRCDFCYAKEAGYIENETIEYENLKRIIDFCDEGKVKFLVFTGGEPTLYPNLIEILQYIKNKKHNMVPAITTNGILLENLDYCKSMIDNGVGYIDISLKGKNNVNCYTVSGQYCFEQQMNAIRNLSTLPVEFTCSMVLTWNNINNFHETIKNAWDNGARQFSFTFVIDNKRLEKQPFRYLEKYNPFHLIKSFISQIDKLNTITTNWWIEYSFPLCVYTPKQLSLLKGKLAAPCQIHKRNGITFNTKMNLLPCSMYFDSPGEQLGVDFFTYKDFIKKINHMSYKFTIDSLNLLPSEDCHSCEYLRLCYGGCPITWKNYSFAMLKQLKTKYMDMNKNAN